jgi:predicted O-linked N-acetylglucosamine transferase (SPINDLY family)
LKGGSMNNLLECKENWYEKFVSVKSNLSKENSFEHEKQNLLEIHALLHEKSIIKQNEKTYYDYLWENLNESTCKIISKKETSVAWNICHITRIEDLTSNILMAGKDQIFDDHVQKELGITIKDTGNAMTVSEIEIFNKQINLQALKAYRKAVGKSAQKILAKLQFSDLKRKVEKADIEKIRSVGGVTNDEKSSWLLNFWGRKNMLGLITMPVTKHQIVHLNDCFNIKARYN